MPDSDPTVPFDVGDSVRVKEGVEDSDYPDEEIGGWQGRIVEIPDEEPPTLLVEWDSVTLEEMPLEILEEAELEGLDWERYYVNADDVEAAEPRDTPQDVKQTRQTLYDRLRWVHLDEDVESYIRQVLTEVDSDDERAVLQAWKENLTERLSFPFEAKVDEYQDGGPLRSGDEVRVTRITLLDYLYGFIATVRHGRATRQIPLADLEPLDETSDNYLPLQAYRVWFANR